ncbi:hypothetical protein V8017_06590 [Stenotrophomonas rhizophila]
MTRSTFDVGTTQGRSRLCNVEGDHLDKSHAFPDVGRGSAVGRGATLPATATAILVSMPVSIPVAIPVSESALAFAPATAP